jgi:hypothetical protein
MGIGPMDGKWPHGPKQIQPRRAIAPIDMTVAAIFK